MFRIAICDDDKMYVNLLEQLIMKSSYYIPNQFIINKYYSGESFILDLEMTFDLVIMDIQMHKIDGITAALKLREIDKDVVLVFCTGVQLPKPEFFEIQPFRYLMKFYETKRIEKEIEIIIEKMMETKRVFYLDIFEDGKMSRISCRDVLYISNLKRGCKVHILDHKTNRCYEIKTKDSLKAVYENIKNKGFEFAHNSYIVNFSSIIAVKGDVLTLEDLTQLNISRTKKNIFHNKFASYLGRKYKRRMT